MEKKHISSKYNDQFIENTNGMVRKNKLFLSGIRASRKYIVKLMAQI